MVNDDDINNAVGELKQKQLQSAIYAGIRQQPDTEAKLQDLAKRVGLPVDVVRMKQPEVEMEAKLQSFDYEKINKESPKTASFLSDPNNAAIAHDDVENMGEIEKTLRKVGMKISKGSLALLSAAPAFNEGAWGVMQAGAELGSKYGTGPLKDWGILPEDIMGVMGEQFSKYRQQQGAMAKGFVTEPGAGHTESAVYSGLQSLGLNLLTLPYAAATKSATVPLAMMSGQVGGQAYGQGREQGLSPERAITFGGEQAIAEYVTEKIPAGAFINNLNKGYVKAALEFAAKDVIGEQVATVWQDFNEWANLNPEKTVKEFLAERPGAAYQTLIATLVGGGGAVTIAKGAELLSGYGGNMQKAQEAEANAAALDQINELATASKLAQRNPERFQQFIEAAAENGPVENVYIDAKTLAQSGIAGELAKVSPAVAEQLDRALVGNSQVAIPIAEYAAKIAPSEYAQALRMHLRTDPEGYTLAEAEEYMKEAAPQLQAEMAKVLESKNVDDTFKQSMQVVKQTVLDELNAVGRWTPAANEVYAMLEASYYAKRALQLGRTPEEEFNRRRVSVGAEPMTGKAYNAGGQTKPVGLDLEAIPAKLKVDVTKTVKGQSVTKKVLATKAITAYDQRIKALDLLRGCVGG
jgi:hypothetical protein